MSYREIHTWAGMGMEVEERDQPCFLCLHFSVSVLGRRWYSCTRRYHPSYLSSHPLTAHVKGGCNSIAQRTMSAAVEVILHHTMTWAEGARPERTSKSSRRRMSKSGTRICRICTAAVKEVQLLKESCARMTGESVPKQNKIQHSLHIDSSPVPP